jgi:hypothetical protein
VEIVEQWNEGQKFGGAAVLGDEHRWVAWRVDSEIAMDGLGGMEKNRRGSGAAQRRDHLARYVAGFADTGDDDFAGMIDDQLDRADESAVQPFGGTGERGRFDFDSGPGCGEPILTGIAHSVLPPKEN